ncbi:peptidyl-prolyl cis-trans isomerase FKBP17-1 chloroplastic [Prunus yedoensis var. nudiflora]|uniref:peptidylprolyl isomerase n=1 Tax=Prunus yedoensis var. nudiflora TaxID=2094558 RepID=A0A314Y8Q7_PRUYE|nr:peptidyl-prolyl cis-trans isomerase FKBP17-1 chloroplastic [Prunus yedoensis var. nudiflora]
MILQCFAALQCSLVPHRPTVHLVHPKIISPTPSSSSTITRRGALSAALIFEALELRLDDGEVPAADGNQVAVNYYGRLATKQGLRFDSTYDHKDENGEPIPFVFVIGSRF